MSLSDFNIAPGSEDYQISQESFTDELKAFFMDVPGLKDTKDEALNRINLSITNFVKKLMIMSRVFIQNSIVDDPSLNDNLATIQNQYLAFILAALSLNEDVGSNRTIRTQIELVATENYNSLKDIFRSAGYSVGREDTVPQGNTPEEKIRNYQEERLWRNQRKQDDYKDDRKFEETVRPDQIEKRRIDRQEKINEDSYFNEQERRRRFNDPASNARIEKDTRNLSLASGRIIQVTIGGKQVTIPVQLVPTIIPDEVAEKFISLNFQLSWRQRLVQAKAGEISWFKDFLFNIDQINKVKEALKKDKTGSLYEMKNRQKNAAFAAAQKAIFTSNNQNIANSIFIFEKSSFMRNAKAFGLNWKNPAARDKFFNYTFSFMCVLIDPIYAKSEYYWSGIDAVGEYSAKQLKNASEKEAYNLKDIMSAFTQGHSPKFI